MSAPLMSREWEEFARTDPSIINHNQEIDKVREMVDQQSQKNNCLLREPVLALLAEKVTTEDSTISLPGVPNHAFKIRTYRPSRPDTGPLPLLLYFHSGFWSTGNLDADELGCRTIIANGNDIVIISFEYRLAPENSWHTIFSDAENAMIWASNNAQSYGGNISKGFLIGGAVAGAHLASICAIRARNRHPEIKLTGQVLIVPSTIFWQDIETMPEAWKRLVTSHVQNAHAPLLSEVDFQRYLTVLNVPKDEQRRGENFPVWADLKGLPTTYLAMDGPDPMRDEGYLYEMLLRKAGVQTRTDHYELPNWFVQFPTLPTTSKAGAELASGVRWLLDTRKYTF